MAKDSYLIRILDAAASIHGSIAGILEAKAAEAEIYRSWVVTHQQPSAYSDRGEMHKQSLELNEQIIEVIEGITKMELGLARNLKIILNQDKQPPAGLGELLGSGNSL
jgi:hypothetical protein